MSLRSGLPLWTALDSQPLQAEPLAGDARCEVAVVGGGVTGALVADRLVQEGVDTILIDKRPLGTGSTAASTGLLQYEIDTPLVELIAKVGEKNAVHAYQRGLVAIDEIEQLTQELDNPCGFVRRESLYFASHWWHAGRLRQEYDCRKRHGFRVDLLHRSELAEISSISARVAVRSHGDAQIDPYRFTTCLLRRAQSRGLRAFANTELLDVDESGQSVVLRTSTGNLTARRIVFATGYDSQRYLSQRAGDLHTTYAMASEPLAEFSGWPNAALIWESARPYFYARQTVDGRAIIGGEDTVFRSDHQRGSLVERKWARLQKRFAQLFPAIRFSPEFAWAGVFGESKDGLAYIGQPADRPNAFFAVGYGGNGITFSMIASRLITDLYFGRPNDDAVVFRFGR